MFGTGFAIAAALVAALVFYGEQKKYHVHNEGFILITGAGSGIGRHAAEYLANNYNFTVLAGVRKESDVRDIKKMDKSNLIPLIIDVSSHESCTSAVEILKNMMQERKLPFVGLVNNAGIGHHGPIEFENIDEAKSLFNTNFFGTLDITQQTLPLLRESKGRILMISSMSGFVSSSFSGLYSSSKFAMESLSDALRREISSYGVSVSVIQPGYVKTNILVSSKNSVPDSYKEQIPQILQLYPSVVEGREKAFNEMENSKGPETTTTPAIIDALTSAFPKTRYKVAGAIGLSANAVSWLVWLLSDRLEDIFMK